MLAWGKSISIQSFIHPLGVIYSLSTVGVPMNPVSVFNFRPLLSLHSCETCYDDVGLRGIHARLKGLCPLSSLIDHPHAQILIVTPKCALGFGYVIVIFLQCLSKGLVSVCLLPGLGCDQ